jgi:nucleoside 2-deoxyribosyltransferase
MLAYLAGAIEYAPDLGRGWRRDAAALLRSLGYEVYDPAEDERKSLSEEEQRNLRVWKTTDLPRFQEAVRKIIDFDLDIVSRAGCIICYWDENGARGGGTSAELTWARRRGIPVYMVTPLPVASISGWVLGCCSRIFRDFEELKKFLQTPDGV